jgi:hypothetical protein
VATLALSMLAKDPRVRPTAEQVYEALLPFRRPLLAPAQRRERGDHLTRLTDAEAERLMANVRTLLDNDRPSEAISLLEDGVGRAGHDAFLDLRLRHFLAAALFYAGEYTRAAPLFDVVGRDYRKHLPPNDPYVLDCSYHAGHAYAEIGKPEKALPQLRFYVQNAGVTADRDEADRILESRFVPDRLGTARLRRRLARHRRPDPPPGPGRAHARPRRAGTRSRTRLARRRPRHRHQLRDRIRRLLDPHVPPARPARRAEPPRIPGPRGNRGPDVGGLSHRLGLIPTLPQSGG